jgi:T-complex protein 11.
LPIFNLDYFLAPKIRAHGIEFLKQEFEQRFGSFDSLLRNNDVQVPHMKIWLTEIIESCSVITEERQELLTSEEKRVETLIQRGWVDSILFRSPRTVESEEGSTGYDRNYAGNKEESIGNHGHGHEKHNTSGKFYMPEIFYLDTAEVKEIRLVTKMSVVGSALALHATNIAGAKDNVLRQDPLPHEIQHCRTKLIHAMGNRAIGTQELYEQAVGDAVVELARELNPHFECNAAQEDILRSRTAASMRGEDPVINLLDNRMRAIFRKMMVFNPLEQGQVPPTLRTGRDVTHGSRVYIDMSSGMHAETLHQVSKEEFINKGFSFYAEELAEATVMSHTMISLAMKIHGTWVEKMFLERIQHI